MHIKYLTLAAAIMAAGSAQAADLNKPAKAAIDYVKVCDAYGAGFFYIPGTDTCLKIGGAMRNDYGTGTTNRNSDVGVYYSNLKSGASTRGSNAISDDFRAYETFDARTNTDYGLLRSYINFHEDMRTSNTNSAVTRVEFDRGYVQFGGLEAGRDFSNYNFLYNSNIDWQFEAFTDVVVNQLS